MNGKKKCKILKEIRRRIAEENDIAYVTSECKHQGNCLGTCPKCEAEVRSLEEQIEVRRRAGYAVALTGLALTLTAATASCVPSDDAKQDTTVASTTTDYGELGGADVLDTELMGDVPTSADPETEPPTMGDPLETEPPIMGDPFRS